MLLYHTAAGTLPHCRRLLSHNAAGYFTTLLHSAAAYLVEPVHAPRALSIALSQILYKSRKLLVDLSIVSFHIHCHAITIPQFSERTLHAWVRRVRVRVS